MTFGNIKYNQPMPIDPDLPRNQVLQGDCIELLANFPEKSIDLVFADPPYNLQLRQELWRPNHTRVEAVNDAWDQFESFADYDRFSQQWLAACRRVLKDDGSLWVIGTYHNIHRLGAILQDLGFWILNEVVWIKTNPMPNFRGVRFTNAHETLLWAAKSRDSHYTFNHHAMKSINDDLQMRSDWLIPLCTGAERIKVDGKKAHSTQKPEALLYRVLLASSQPGDLVLDPFFGTGTTGAVAKKLQRQWIGIERDETYVHLARKRIQAITPLDETGELFRVEDTRRLAARISPGKLLEAGLLSPGQELYFKAERSIPARLRADGQLILVDGRLGSIHKLASTLLNGSPCNGWTCWTYSDASGDLHPLDDLRQKYAQDLNL